MLQICWRSAGWRSATRRSGDGCWDKAAAVRLIKKRLKRHGLLPTVIVTDKLGSYRAALQVIGFTGRHEHGIRANNRAENAHQQVRRRERKMQDLISRATLPGFRAAAHNAWN